jgi:tetratricopeptide (TPR) repeat protein
MKKHLPTPNEGGFPASAKPEQVIGMRRSRPRAERNRFCSGGLFRKIGWQAIMSENPNASGQTPRPSRPPPGSAARQFAPEIPPSKTLQWFLLVALVISGAAYVTDEWTQLTSSQTQVHRESKLHRLALSQAAYLAHAKSGDEALAAKHYDRAVSEYRLALESQNVPEGHEHLGNALLGTGNSDAALAQFREAVRLNPNLTSAYGAWGQTLCADGKLKEASGVFQEGLQHNPDSGLLHYNLALTLQQLQTNAQAQSRAAAAAGNGQDAAAQDAQSKELATEAVHHFAEAGRHGSSGAAFWLPYGELLIQQGEFAQAQKYLARATSEDPNLSGANFQLALAEDHLGRYADAIAHYNKVLALSPDDPETLDHLALLYATATNAEVRSAKMAVQLATRACAAAGQNARYMDTLARSYAADGDFLQAITWEDKAMKRAMQLNDDEQVRQFQQRYALYLDHKTQ